jgi:hypothetical protein
MNLYDSPSTVQDEMYIYVSSYDEQLAQVRKRNAPARRTSKSFANATSLAERMKAFQQKDDSETKTIVGTEPSGDMSEGSMEEFIGQLYPEADTSTSEQQARRPSTIKDKFGAMKLHDSTGNVQEEIVLSSFGEQRGRRPTKSLANTTNLADRKKAIQLATAESGKPPPSGMTKLGKGTWVERMHQGPGPSLQNNVTPRRLSKSLANIPSLADRIKGFSQKQVVPPATLAIIKGGNDYCERTKKHFIKQHKSKLPEDTKSLIPVQQKELVAMVKNEPDESEGSMEVELLYKEMEQPTVTVATEEATGKLVQRRPSTVKDKFGNMKLHDSTGNVQKEMYLYVSNFDEQMAEVRKRNLPRRTIAKSLANAASLKDRLLAFQQPTATNDHAK